MKRKKGKDDYEGINHEIMIVLLIVTISLSKASGSKI